MEIFFTTEYDDHKVNTAHSSNRYIYGILHHFNCLYKLVVDRWSREFNYIILMLFHTIV